MISEKDIQTLKKIVRRIELDWAGKKIPYDLIKEIKDDNLRELVIEAIYSIGRAIELCLLFLQLLIKYFEQKKKNDGNKKKASE